MDEERLNQVVPAIYPDCVPPRGGVTFSYLLKDTPRVVVGSR